MAYDDYFERLRDCCVESVIHKPCCIRQTIHSLHTTFCLDNRAHFASTAAESAMGKSLPKDVPLRSLRRSCTTVARHCVSMNVRFISRSQPSGAADRQTRRRMKETRESERKALNILRRGSTFSGSSTVESDLKRKGRRMR